MRNRVLTGLAALLLTSGGMTLWQLRKGGDRAISPVSTVPLDPDARAVAGEFISTAVARKDLARAWRLSGPDIRQDLTLREWMTGRIPVVPYPNPDVDSLRFTVDRTGRDESPPTVWLRGKGESKTGQPFYIGLKKHGDRWLVDYWAPWHPPLTPGLCVNPP